VVEQQGAYQAERDDGRQHRYGLTDRGPAHALHKARAFAIRCLFRKHRPAAGSCAITPEIRAKQLQLLKEALPKVSRVAVLRSAATTAGPSEYEATGRALGLRVQFVEVRGAEDLGRAFAALGGERVDALLVPGDTLLFTERQRVAALAREHRLPGIHSLREFTEAGGLMSYSARISEQFRRAAGYVDISKHVGRVNSESIVVDEIVA
jgi:putative tryptophan/tyrosine transport system substrate-binding protein